MAEDKLKMFTIESSGYDALWDLAQTIIETKTSANKSGVVVDSSETLAAKALQIQIDEAKESKTEFLIFSENEVVFLSSVVS